MKRIFEDPFIKHKIIVVKTAEETNGLFMLLEIELLPGGGNITHFHTSFAQEFIPVAGVLYLEKEGSKMLLRPGRKILVIQGEKHRFFNPGKTTIIFQVRISPPCKGLLASINIYYGLSADGRANRLGLPRRMDQLSVLLNLSDVHFTGWIALLQFLLYKCTSVKRRMRVEKNLYHTYCA